MYATVFQPRTYNLVNKCNCIYIEPDENEYYNP